ncbi:MAG: T9SS type A sorting domain-containing protein [Haliscomenobacter sp.]|nr:T9SS type A sorting domain-containing protein [Haliscomenobacter sp.]
MTATTTAGTPLAISAPQSGTNTNNYSAIEISIPNGTSSVALKIVALNNDGNEIWNIDDIELTGSSTCTPPTTQASGFASANILYNQMDISFTRGNGTGGVLVLAKAGSAVDANPSASTTYTANAAFGSGDQIGTGNYVVYNGAANGAGNASGNIAISGLSASTTYHFAVYEYDGGAGSECYRTSDKLTGNAATSAGPTITASPASLTGFTYNQGSGPSASQSYTLSATNLSPAAGDLTVTGSANYEVSTDNSTFTGSVNVAYTGSALGSTPIYVRLKAGLSAGTYNSETVANSGGGASTKNVTCSGSVALPTITVSPTSRTGFTYLQGAGPSASQSYTLSATNLSPAAGDLTVTGSANYEVSTDNSTFTGSVNVAYTGSALGSTTIYVRLKAGLSAGTYNSETVANSGGGASTKNVTCSGSVTAPPLYFRTRSSGPWNEVATWDSSEDNSVWNEATTTPSSADLSIAIRSGNEVAITASVTIDQVTVESGGTLDLTGGTLTIANGSGTDLLVQGILRNSTNSAFTVHASASIVVDNGGKYEHNPSSAGGSVTDMTWNAGATCEITKAAAAPGNLDQAFHHFIWASSNQGSANLNLVGNLTTINGNFTVSNTGTGSLRLTGSNVNTLQVGGNCTISSGATLSLGNGGAASTLNIDGNLSLEGTLNLMDGSSSNGFVNLKGNLTGSGTITESTSGTGSTLTFNGTSLQTALFGTISNQVNLKIDNSSGVSLSSNLTMPPNTLLTLTSGLLKLNSYNLTMTATGISFGGVSTSSYVQTNGAGKLVLAVSTIETQFPIGNASFNPAYLTRASDSDTYGLSVSDQVLLNGTSGPEVTSGVVGRTWDVAAINTVGSLTVKLQWYSGDEKPGFTRASSNVSHYQGIWDLGPIGNGGSAEPYNLSRSGVTSLSPFTVSSGGALPIALFDFKAEAFQSSALLTWRTASELNNDYMAVERSADAIEFQEIGRVKGQGTTQQPQDYRFTDEDPLPGINYYRLRQVDIDGAMEYHKVVAVDFRPEGAASTGLTAFPSPATDDLHVRLAAPFQSEAEYTVTDLQGRVVLRGVFPAQSAQETISIQPLPSGLFVLSLSQDGRTEVVRFVKR